LRRTDKIMADRDLANHNAMLAAKVEVMPELDVHLAFIDTEAGEDKYHVLQGLVDPTAGGDPNCHYLLQRWGCPTERKSSKESRGQMHIDGPMLQSSVAVMLSKIFKEKTGAEFFSTKPGDRALPGMYWLQQQSTPDLSAKWEYYVSDGVDHKKTGWHPYTNYGSEEVEELYAQHVANGGESRTATRVVHSGRYPYMVDLAKMKQQNMNTHKVRTIRRSAGDHSLAATTRKAMKRCAEAAPAPTPGMKSMKVRIA